VRTSRQARTNRPDFGGTHWLQTRVGPVGAMLALRVATSSSPALLPHLPARLQAVRPMPVNWRGERA
jgi:hypothetical protein